MAGYINISDIYKFDGIGLVHVNVKANARTVRARWKGGMLYAFAPRGIPYDDLHRILHGFLPNLQDTKPASLYYIGQTIQTEEFTVDIVKQTRSPREILMSYKENHGIIAVGSHWDMDSNDTMVTISKMLCRIASKVAASILLPAAREISERLDVKPLMWTISNGHRTLGHCDSKGIIALSYALVFYPSELREYVICHELAHLSEMNHSPRFHVICDAYCGGREKELVAKLKAYHLPIIR